MLDVQVHGGTMAQEEIDAYISYGYKKYAGKEIYAVDIRIDGEDVDLKFYFRPRFEHVYRATDYLVKTLDVLNDAKQAEFRDKVTHPVD